MKSQGVRLVDVFLLGPAIALGGAKLREARHPVLGTVLILGGLATVIYNWANYSQMQKRIARGVL